MSKDEWTDTELDEITRLYATGLSSHEIAKRVGRSEHEIKEIERVVKERRSGPKL